MSTFIATYRRNGYNFAVREFTAPTIYAAQAQALNWAESQTGSLVILADLVKVAA